MSIESYPERLKKAEVWGGITDPAEHNPADFRYLVHGINPNARETALQYLEHEVTKGVIRDQWAGNQSISLYHSPEKLIERTFLSMSLIDQNHTGTWGEIGLIIETPKTNIILTSIYDSGSFEYTRNLRALHRHAAFYEYMDGDALLQNTDPFDYNEVIAIPRVDDYCLWLKGFFYRTDPAGQACEPALADKMHYQAARLSLPTVAIPSNSVGAPR